MYESIVNESQIEVGSGATVIVTGWTEPSSVLVKPIHYAAKGALRSCHAGIDNLIRNLLANPQVKGVVIYDACRFNDAPDGNPLTAVKNLIKWGVDFSFAASGRMPIVGGVGTVSSEFSPAAIASLQHLKVIKVSYHDDIPGACLFLNQTETEARSRFYYPPPEIEGNQLPPTIGAVIKGDGVSHCWLQILNLIREAGTIREASNGDGYWQEVLNLTTVIGKEPEPYPEYLPVSPESVETYLPQLLEGVPPEDVRYTYGSRIRSWFGSDQLEQVAQKLARNPNSTSAVISIWDTNDHNNEYPPCLNHLWFRVLNQELTLTALFRSNDMFSAWPLNVLGLQRLQEEVVEKINQIKQEKSHPFLENSPIIKGSLTTISESAHIYDYAWEHSDSLLSQHDSQLPTRDPAGDFLIGKGSVKLTDRYQEPIKSIQHPNPNQLKGKAIRAFPQITVPHALYLGYELGRLENKNYKQR